MIDGRLTLDDEELGTGDAATITGPIELAFSTDHRRGADPRRRPARVRAGRRLGRGVLVANARGTSATDALAAADLPTRRCLELAYEALRAGGLACGSVVQDASGEIVAEGRNHAYDPPTGSEPLEGTPLAHAELNALARVATDRDLAGDTLWSSQEPCSMCTAAAAFVGVGAIAYLAPDPWALATDQSRAQGAAVAGDAAAPPVSGPTGEPWRTIANALFILSIAATRGPDHSTVTRSATLDPAATETALALLASPRPWPPTLGGLLEPVWDDLLNPAGG